MRTEEEVIRAHDQLLAFILGEVVPIEPQDRERLALLAQVLCWVLRHDHNTGFEETLAQLTQAAAAAGMMLQKQEGLVQ